MRALAVLTTAAVALVATGALAFSLGSPAARKVAAGTPVPAPPAPSRTAGIADFPNCPAPAVNGMNIRAMRGEDGTALTIFVVVQNVGNRAFFADSGVARLTVALGGRSLASFDVRKLSASEVKFFSVEARAQTGERLADISADLTFQGDARIGRVADTLDCQTTDNAVVRRGRAIEASLERSAG
jgi:hypothetical protein